jgi:hypothetical protein
VTALSTPARAATLVLVGVGVVAATACTGGGVADNATTAPSTKATTTAGGFTFKDTAGGYSVLFPAEPVDQQQSIKLPDGTDVPFTVHVWSDPTSGVQRSLASDVIVYPAGTELSLERARDGLVASFKGATLASSESIALQGRNGLAFAIDLADGSSYFSRIYADDARLYQLIYIGRDITPTDAEAKAFFDSFEFI